MKADAGTTIEASYGYGYLGPPGVAALVASTFQHLQTRHTARV